MSFWLHSSKNKLAEDSAHCPASAYTKSTVRLSHIGLLSIPLLSMLGLVTPTCSYCREVALLLTQVVISARERQQCTWNSEKGREKAPLRPHAFSDLHVPKNRELQLEVPLRIHLLGPPEVLLLIHLPSAWGNGHFQDLLHWSFTHICHLLTYIRCPRWILAPLWHRRLIHPTTTSHGPVWLWHCHKDNLLHPTFMLLGQILRDAAHRRVGGNYSVKRKHLCPIPEGAQGQAGWGTRQHELMGGNPPTAGVGTGWALRSLIT